MRHAKPRSSCSICGVQLEESRREPAARGLAPGPEQQRGGFSGHGVSRRGSASQGKIRGEIRKQGMERLAVRQGWQTGRAAAR